MRRIRCVLLASARLKAQFWSPSTLRLSSRWILRKRQQARSKWSRPIKAKPNLSRFYPKRKPLLRKTILKTNKITWKKRSFWSMVCHRPAIWLSLPQRSPMKARVPLGIIALDIRPSTKACQTKVRSWIRKARALWKRFLAPKNSKILTITARRLICAI